MPVSSISITSANNYIRVAGAIALALMLLTLWALTHRYTGLARDGELYALQALSRLQPSLLVDIYLENTNQDQYTLFSPLYAFLIDLVGLRSAEMMLFSLCTVWFLVAAWYVSNKLFTAEHAWLSVAFLITTVGYYGAYRIFSYSENYLTARSMGEALSVTALAVHYHGRPRVALAIACMALLVHPLMVLPAVLLLICLQFPFRIAGTLALTCLIAVLAFAFIAAAAGRSRGLTAVMDVAWLEVVRERAQFLFLKYWRMTDWETAVRPFVCLSLSVLVLPNPHIRRLCTSAMLIGACGIVVAAIAGSIGPIAILLQGQAWRWLWVTTFVSVLLVMPTTIQLLKHDRGGPLCALLLVMSWVFSVVNALACVAAALAVWAVRSRVSNAAAKSLQWGAAALGGIVLIWMLANCWTFMGTAIAATGRESIAVGRLREMFGLGVSGVSFAWISWYGILRSRSAWLISCLCVVFLGLAAWTLPGSMKQLETVGTSAEVREFSAWRNAIPRTSNVLIVPTRNSASFIWFTLNRPSYMSVDQSSGVVFSRATSLEVRRRGEVLRSLGNPDWKLLTANLAAESAGAGGAVTPPPKPTVIALTPKILTEVCADSELGFVIAKENLDFNPMTHSHPGAFKSWNLYDCRTVRSAGPAA